MVKIDSRGTDESMDGVRRNGTSLRQRRLSQSRSKHSGPLTVVKPSSRMTWGWWITGGERVVPHNCPTTLLFGPYDGSSVPFEA